MFSESDDYIVRSEVNNIIGKNISADLILIPKVYDVGEGVYAAASAMAISTSNNRPILGGVLLRSSYNFTRTNAQNFLIMLLLHEVTHVLGFSNGLFELSKSTITNINSQNNVINNINCPPFVPSNYNEKEGNIFTTRSNTNDSSLKDKETDSTSSISEKKEEEEEENNYDSFNHFEKSKMLEQNLEKSEYLVEMFGRKGWICILCNNFNYETRTKCNRCGEVKKPKKIVDLRTKYEPKEYKEIKERSNKKGDWVCMNCKNLNYSFRTACNRCKIPKVNPYLNTQAFKREITKMQNYSKYFFSPSFVIFNNMNNVYKNNVDKYKK